MRHLLPLEVKQRLAQYYELGLETAWELLALMAWIHKSTLLRVKSRPTSEWCLNSADVCLRE